MTLPPPRFLLGIVLLPGMLAAQAGSTVGRTGVTFESYSFGSGLAFKRISEFTIPIGVTQRVGDRFVIDVSTAFARASVSVAGGGGGPVTHSGVVGNELRGPLSVIPGRRGFNLLGPV